MEAMWTRFCPLVHTLRRMVHEEKVIGGVQRVFCDFGLDLDLTKLGPESRLKNPALGAGSLLDVGIYSLTWGLLALEPGSGEEAEAPKVVAAQSLTDSVDIASSIILLYPNTGKKGILTSTNLAKSSKIFCRIEGSEGYITVEGFTASSPSAFTVHERLTLNGAISGAEPAAGKRFELAKKAGMGFYWEADAVALDIAAGRKEDAAMPWAETVRVLEILDEVRRQGGARFPQDGE